MLMCFWLINFNLINLFIINIKVNENKKLENYSFHEGWFWLNKVKNYSLFGICQNEWYPLITIYIDANDLFGIHSNLNSLKNDYISFQESPYKQKFIDKKGFLDYLNKNYGETYSKMKNKFRG
jgi:hypothetical protein